MNKFSNRGLKAALLIWVAAVTCNMPTAVTQVATEANSPVQDTAATSVALTLTAQPVSAAPSTTLQATATTQATATQCNPFVTANTDVNVRVGPDTAYDIIGYLPAGGTAAVAGRNDANTWWYVDFAAGSGGHAWVAGSVTTAACLPPVVQVVAAPALPTAVPTEVADEDEDGGGDTGAKPDIYVSEFTISPATPIMGQNAHVRIGTYNQGNAASGQYVVLWYGLSSFASPSCSWTVNHSNAHGGRILECDFVFQSWYPINKTSLVIVDASNQVDESNEGNNQGTISPFGVAQP
jgi:uncharacterized protein YraI